MDGDLERELEKLLQRILEQGRFLDKQLRDPDLARPDAIESTVLEFILKAVNTFAIDTCHHGETGSTFQQLLADLRSMHESLSRRRLDVHLHLAELADGWTCTGCGYAIPKEARIRGLHRPPLQLLLRCKVCDKETELAGAGYEAFSRIFGALHGGGPWNPRGNKFIWDGD